MTAQNARVLLGGTTSLDVRKLRVEEHMNRPFSIHIEALSPVDELDLGELVGEKAAFELNFPQAPRIGLRRWTGVVASIDHVRRESGGLSRYAIHVVPEIALLAHRKNMRIFQYLSELEIVEKLLLEWEIPVRVEVDRTLYKKRKFKVQYAESDLDFVHRMLEEIGVSYFFETDEQSGDTRMVLADAPHDRAPRPGPLANLPNEGNMVLGVDVALDARAHREVRPTRYTIRDHDYRRPADYWLGATEAIPDVRGRLSRLERFQYIPGAFLFEAQPNGDSPAADARGTTRSDERIGQRMAKRRLEAQYAPAQRFSFRTNALDVAPGVVVRVLDYPRLEGSALLVTSTVIEGDNEQNWFSRVSGATARIPYRPALVTPRPRALGVESATVVTPEGREVHCDEHGRVNVHFHWDRESRRNETSSCWVHVSQGWAGTTYGSSALPRRGQEVLVAFICGDPDRPIIVGRVYTNLERTPYTLPGNLDRTVVARSQTLGGTGYNEISMTDSANREVLFMRAQRNMTVAVGNDNDNTIGNDQTTTVRGNQSFIVGKSQMTTVALDQLTVVGHDQTNTVTNERTDYIGQKYTIMVGQSKIVMTPTKISIVSPEIEIHATEQCNDIKGKPIYLNCDERVAPQPAPLPPGAGGAGAG